MPCCFPYHLAHYTDFFPAFLAHNRHLSPFPMSGGLDFDDESLYSSPKPSLPTARVLASGGHRQDLTQRRLSPVWTKGGGMRFSCRHLISKPPQRTQHPIHRGTPQGGFACSHKCSSPRGRPCLTAVGPAPFWFQETSKPVSPPTPKLKAVTATNRRKSGGRMGGWSLPKPSATAAVAGSRSFRPRTRRRGFDASNALTNRQRSTRKRVDGDMGAERKSTAHPTSGTQTKTPGSRTPSAPWRISAFCVVCVAHVHNPWTTKPQRFTLDGSSGGA